MASKANVQKTPKGWKCSSAHPDPRVEQYIDLVLKNNTKVLSYAVAFEYKDIIEICVDSKNNRRNGDYFTIAGKASKLYNDEAVQKRLQYLNNQKAKRLHNERFLSLEAKREILKNKIEEVLADGGSEHALAKLIQIDSQIAGHFAPEKRETTLTVNPLDEVVDRILNK